MLAENHKPGRKIPGMCFFIDDLSFGKQATDTWRMTMYLLPV